MCPASAPPQKTVGRHRLTLATKVTILRLLGIPVFVLLMIYYEISLRQEAPVPAYRWAAFGCFLAIALTDALDGFLARLYNEVTWLGRVLDPLADKILLLAGIILFTRPGLTALQPQFPIWFTVLVISRDIILVAGAYLIDYFTGAVHVHPRMTGKMATALQMLAVGWAIANFSHKVFSALVLLAGLFTLGSFLQYLGDGWHQFDSERSEEAPPSVSEK